MYTDVCARSYLRTVQRKVAWLETQDVLFTTPSLGGSDSRGLCSIESIDVCLVMLRVVNRHNLLGNCRLKVLVPIRQGWQRVCRAGRREGGASEGGKLP